MIDFLVKPTNMISVSTNMFFSVNFIITLYLLYTNTGLSKKDTRQNLEPPHVAKNIVTISISIQIFHVD